MEYRAFGRLDWKPSALGFGAMRLPTLGGDHARIDEPAATEMLRTAIDAGVNYIDTACVYHHGHSEPFLGRALQDGYRERVRLATKLSHILESEAEFNEYLDKQLAALQTDHIDFYLLHGLNRRSWDVEEASLSWLEKAVSDGRIGHIGFSFHDDLATFQRIVDAYDWTFCQIMYNYMDVDDQAGTEGLRYASEQGLAVVVMEPLRGGGLVEPLPASVEQLWDSSSTKRTPAEWALQWVWDHPEVSLVLSGMSAVSQVKENLASAARSASSSLKPDDLSLIAKVRQAYRKLVRVPCSNCRYCLPCPQSVAIPRIFRLYNDLSMYGNEAWIRMQYFEHTPEDIRATACIACGRCEDVCPQQIRIPARLAEAHTELLTTLG